MGPRRTEGRRHGAVAPPAPAEPRSPCCPFQLAKVQRRRRDPAGRRPRPRRHWRATGASDTSRDREPACALRQPGTARRGTRRGSAAVCAKGASQRKPFHKPLRTTIRRRDQHVMCDSISAGKHREEQNEVHHLDSEQLRSTAQGPFRTMRESCPVAGTRHAGPTRANASEGGAPPRPGWEGRGSRSPWARTRPTSPPAHKPSSPTAP
jgi:hypothetical protein